MPKKKEEKEIKEIPKEIPLEEMKDLACKCGCATFKAKYDVNGLRLICLECGNDEC